MQVDGHVCNGATCVCASLICVIAGKLVYHGPREEVLPFFESQGMHCPERKADSDFLQEVTSRKDQKVLTATSPTCMRSAATTPNDHHLMVHPL